ncbi:hypothetical protein ABEB36_002573 [Hypothenemus hampei]|uniref:Uncharacterized protein n=1 Tax=Hypothenemus hampei TaxID=57062 RepID=A0ABD1F681_HYPHA
MTTPKMDNSLISSDTIESLANFDANEREMSRSSYSAASSSEVFPSYIHKKHPNSRPHSAKLPNIQSSVHSSNIPLPTKTSGPVKPRSNSRCSSISGSRTGIGKVNNNAVNDKHTLEVQFINKNKVYLQLKNEIMGKQKVLLDNYLKLKEIKQKLEHYGKVMNLDEIKLVRYKDINGTIFTSEGGGEQIPQNVLMEMKRSIEEIPNTLVEVCKNLLSRRAAIVDLLENVIKSDIDISEVANRMESLKTEGIQLKQSLDAVIKEHQVKISDLITKWQELLSMQQSNKEVFDLKKNLKDQQRLTQETKTELTELKKTMEDKKSVYDKSMAELKGTIKTLGDQITVLQQQINEEKKKNYEISTKVYKKGEANKLTELKLKEMESARRALETENATLKQKVKNFEDMQKRQGSQWEKEKKDLIKKFKEQEILLEQSSVDKSQTQSTLVAIEESKIYKPMPTEEVERTIDSLKEELLRTQNELEEVIAQRDNAMEKCATFEGYVARMGLECKETMNKVTTSIEWGQNQPNTNALEVENYIHDIAKDVKIRELEDKVRKLEAEQIYHLEQRRLMDEIQHSEPTETEQQLTKQQECIMRYQMLLEDSENKLKQKSTEVANLRSEIRQLKVRQEALEEQNYNCPTEELKKMVEEGRQKLQDLMRRSIDSEQKLEHFTHVIEKQTQQMSEMENLLRYRENMAGVLKASRDELILEKESLTRYSQEMRTVLAEVTKEGKMKDRLIKELQEKIDLRERQVGKLEKEVRELETNLMFTNEKRFKLQETISSMEKELQSTKAHAKQLSDINSHNVRPKFLKPF